MSPSSPLPTILLIHGAWHSPAHFRPIRDLLESRSYPTSCPLLPTYNAAPSPPSHVISLRDDVKTIQKELTQLVEEDEKEVIVVMHSYGGVVGSEAIHEKFGKVDREKGGKGKGGVIKLVLIAALILPLGKSVLDMFGGVWPGFVKTEENGLCTIPDPANLFYHDLPTAAQNHWIHFLAPIPMISLETPITHAAYNYYPCIYLFCEDDRAAPLMVQEKMVRDVGMGEMEGFQEVRCGSGHLAFLSQFELVIEILEGIVRG